MNKLSIGPPPVIPLERNLESQLEDVPMVEVVRAEDRKAVVDADRREGRINDGETVKPKSYSTRKNKRRTKLKIGKARATSKQDHKTQSNK